MIGATRDHLFRFVGLLTDDAGARPGLMIPAFSAAIARDRVAQEILMIYRDPDAMQPAAGIGDHVGRVEASAQAGFQQRGVG